MSGAHEHKAAMARTVDYGLERTAYFNFRLLGQRLGLDCSVMKSCFDANENGSGEGGERQLQSGKREEPLISCVGWITYAVDVEVLDKGNAMEVFLGTLFHFAIYLHYSSYLFSRFAWRCGPDLNEEGIIYSVRRLLTTSLFV